MNDIHKEPLFTSWPNPFSDKSLREVFTIKAKNIKGKAKVKGKPSPFSYFVNLFSLSY